MLTLPCRFRNCCPQFAKKLYKKTVLALLRSRCRRHQPAEKANTPPELAGTRLRVVGAAFMHFLRPVYRLVSGTPELAARAYAVCPETERLHAVECCVRKFDRLIRLLGLFDDQF
jgi:hypothetical protein